MTAASIHSPTLAARLKLNPPPLLYHYTSPNGLIGILRAKELWATNTSFLNDFNELVEATNTAKNAIWNMLNRRGLTSGEVSLLEEMRQQAGSAAKRYYVCSFSEDGDSLSQWRAYCPNSGGYAIGFPSRQLAALASELGWFFVKCVYEHEEKYGIINDTVLSFLNEYRTHISEQAREEEFTRNLVWRFCQHLAQIGGAIKHRAFSNEREWRLISPNIPEQDNGVEFRAGVSSVVPYYRFPLVTATNPNLLKFEDQSLVLRCGPTPHPHQAQQAAQFILTRYLGTGAFHGGSDVPFKGW